MKTRIFFASCCAALCFCVAARADVKPSKLFSDHAVLQSGMLVPIEQLLARAGMHGSELTLMPFGGAGPMLGALLAEAAGMTRVLVCTPTYNEAPNISELLHRVRAALPQRRSAASASCSTWRRAS